MNIKIIAAWWHHIFDKQTSALTCVCTEMEASNFCHYCYQWCKITQSKSSLQAHQQYLFMSTRMFPPHINYRYFSSKKKQIQKPKSQIMVLLFSTEFSLLSHLNKLFAALETEFILITYLSEVKWVSLLTVECLVMEFCMGQFFSFNSPAQGSPSNMLPIPHLSLTSFYFSLNEAHLFTICPNISLIRIYFNVQMPIILEWTSL
jgi:hypothetical protein